MTQPTPKQRCTEIRDQLSTHTPNDQWVYLHEQASALHPLWMRAIEEWTVTDELAEDKRQKHIDVVGTAFDRMDDWRFERVKYVKARRNEIDSAISFIWTRSIQKTFRTLLIAPVIRNLGGLLRSCLYIATRGYHDDQMPTLIAQQIFDIAAVRTFFPVDTSNFVGFLSDGESIHGHGGDLDNFHVMLERGTISYNLENALESLYSEAATLWPRQSAPTPVTLDDDIWKQTGDGMSARMYYEAFGVFHSRPRS